MIIILLTLLSPTNTFLMDYSCLTLSQDQVIKFLLTPGATLSFRDVGMKERGKGLEKEYVAVHAINYRFSFTEKKTEGGVE